MSSRPNQLGDAIAYRQRGGQARRFGAVQIDQSADTMRPGSLNEKVLGRTTATLKFSNFPIQRAN
jgi:hypothetical protein